MPRLEPVQHTRESINFVLSRLQTITRSLTEVAESLAEAEVLEIPHHKSMVEALDDLDLFAFQSRKALFQARQNGPP